MAIPSLAMIPSGYKDGKVYSVLPSNGDGDFTFSRGSSATRVNQDGLIEDVRQLGEEEITNGGFDADSDWIKQSNWTIASGKATADGSSQGTLSQIERVAVIGKTYEVKYEISEYDSGNIRFYYGGVFTPFRDGDGSYTEYITAASAESVVTTSIGSTAFTGSIDNISVKEVISFDVPRLDYSDGSCPSLLLEPQSTNLITQGNDLSNWSFGRTTRTITDGINPDGTTEKVLVLATSASNGTHRCYSNSTAIIPNEDYTISVYVKKGTASKIEMELRTPSESPDGFGECVFDINNETITNGKFEVFNNDWYRIQSTGSLSTSTMGAMYIYIYNEDGDKSYAATGNENLYLWGAQLEEQSYATSYIPTNGSIATRLADVCTDAGNASTFNSTEGVLYAEIAALAKDSSYKLISLKAIDYNNRIEIGIGINNKIHAYLVSNSTQLIGSTQQDFTIDEVFKVALKWSNTSGCTLYINGSQITTAGNSTFSALDFNELDFNNFFGNPFYGNIKDLRVYSTALTDAELQELTTI